MNIIALSVASLSVLSQTGDFNWSEDLNINGSGMYNNVMVVRATNDFITCNGELDLQINDINSCYNLTFTNVVGFYDIDILSSENYLSTTTQLEVSTNQVSWEVIDISINTLLADVSVSSNIYGAYMPLSVSTNDYFDTASSIIGYYFRITTTISYDNVLCDNDASTYGIKQGSRTTSNGCTISNNLTNYNNVYISAYNNGYNNGYSKGYSDMELLYNQLQNDYNNLLQTYNDYLDGTTNFQTLLWAIATTPFESFKTIWNVDLMGVNLGGICISLMFVGVVLWIWKKFI